ncbi:MAG: hypothetical protein LBL66_09605 [Clostridiales bacterium]|jgi:putative aldouronate transport system substrate-binding protein|nr:hypothetical protein [Clostridiales bacterium]
MKKFRTKLTAAFILLLALLPAAALSGCLNRNKLPTKLVYPDHPLAEAGKDSWLQVDADDEDIEIDWWLDSTSWDFYQLRTLIYNKTGVKVNFSTALKDDGTELSTKISGGNLPDVMTITDYATRGQLAESKDKKYVWPLNELAARWAPSMLPRLSDELTDYYKASDGNIYGLANNFYADADIAEYADMGEQIVPNQAILARKDYLDAYVAAKKAQNPAFNEDAETTTPAGFIEMCKWVKSNYGLGNDNPTVCLAPFLSKASNGSLSDALTALTEYFCVPKEDAQGNLVYEYGTPEFKEVLLFLNELFREHLLISSNLGYSSAEVITHIRNGRPFAIVGAPHNFSTGLAGRSAAGYDAQNHTFNDANEYVPVVVTNARGDAPLILDQSGRGLRVSMITTLCKRIDRVIKVFDYLISEQGQRDAYYGVEGKTYNFATRPGETAKIAVKNADGNPTEKDHVFRYGQIEWTDYAKGLLGAPQAAGWYNEGIKQISLLTNPMYVMLTSPTRADMDTYQFYARYQMKAALIPYTYSRIPFRYNVDISDVKKFNAMVDIQEDLEAMWIRYLPTVIMAANKAAAEGQYNSAMQEADAYGYQEWLAYQNASYQNGKRQIGVTFGWPKNRPGYAAPAVKLRGEPERYKKELPAYLRISE